MKRMLLVLVLVLAFAFPVFAIEPDEACMASNAYYLDTTIMTGPGYLCGFSVSSVTGFNMAIYDNTSASGVSPIADFYSGVSPTNKLPVSFQHPIFMKNGIYVDIGGGGTAADQAYSGVTTVYTDKKTNLNNKYIIYYRPR